MEFDVTVKRLKYIKSVMSVKNFNSNVAHVITTKKRKSIGKKSHSSTSIYEMSDN